ncbi:hypothetical protein K493DRAFT_332942, partial [Basidiobolus meristosporus CBS 931.73]
MSRFSHSKSARKNTSQNPTDTNVSFNNPHEAPSHSHIPFNPHRPEAIPIMARPSAHTNEGLGIHDAYIELANNLQNSLQTSSSEPLHCMPQEYTHSQSWLSEPASAPPMQDSLHSSDIHIQHQIHEQNANLNPGLTFAFNTQYPGSWNTSWAHYTYPEAPEVPSNGEPLLSYGYTLQPGL